MSMFQNAVLKTISQDEKLIAQRWANYQRFKDKIDFVRDVKEEKYQEGFFKDIFENCFSILIFQIVIFLKLFKFFDKITVTTHPIT